MARLITLITAALLLTALTPRTVSGAGLRAVEFSVERRTRQGESVYLMGDADELGGWQPSRALRMVPSRYPTWTLKVALPEGTTVRTVFLTRDNTPSRLGDDDNATIISQVNTVPVPGVRRERVVRVHYDTGFKAPRLRFQRDGDDWRDVAMTRVGPGGRAGESRWSVAVRTLADTMSFVFHDGGGRWDKPPSGGNYRTTAAQVFVRDGRVHLQAPNGEEVGGRVIRYRGHASAALGNSRDLFIYLPRNYGRGDRRYPVLYAHDGQNLFGSEALFGGWRLAETADRLIAEGRLRELIILGVANTSERMSEYIPPEDGGRADAYGRYLIDELKPFIDRHLKTLTGPENTGVMGSSLGGIVSLQLGWTRPDVFGRVGALSSSFWLDKFTAKLSTDRLPAGLRIWIDSGTAGASADGYEGTVRVRDQLLGRGLALGGRLRHFVHHGAGHNEAAWRARVDRPLVAMFGPGS